VPTIPVHAPGVTYNGLHSTTNPSVPQVAADLVTTKQHFNAKDYLNRIILWAQSQQAVVYIHNMFDDQFGVDTSSPFNYHFGLIDANGKPKGVLF